MNAALSTAHGARRAHAKGTEAKGKKKTSKKVKRSPSEMLEAIDNDDIDDLDFDETGESDLSDSDASDVASPLHPPSKGRHSVDGLPDLADDEQANEANDTEELVMDVIVRHAAVTKQVYMQYYNEAHAGRQRSYVDISSHNGSAPLEVVKDLSVQMGGKQSSAEQPTGFRSLWGTRSILCLPILHPQHPIALVWGVLIMLVDAVYSAFLVPLTAAFCFKPHAYWCRVTEYIAGPIFIVNIILGFHIGFVISFNLRRMIITRPKLVAHFYVTHGGFWLDALASVSFIMAIVGELIDASLGFRIASRLVLLFRLIRVYRLLTVMFMASVSARSGKEGALLSSFRLYAMTLLFTAAFFINVFACLFYVVADMEGLDQSWLSKYSSSYGPTSVPPMDILNATAYRQWQISVYYVTTTLVTVGFGDVTPATTLEQIVAIFMMLTAACMFAVLISSISEALSSMTADARTGGAMRKKLAMVKQWMADRNMPDKERQRILAFYSGVWRQHQKEYQNELHIFEELPSWLRAKVTRGLLHRMLLHSVKLPSRSSPGVMKHWPLQPAHVQLLAERFVPLEVMPGHDLFTEGSDVDNIYLLEFGRLEVFQHQRVLYTYDNTEDGQEAIWIGMSGVLSFYDIMIARKRPMCVRAVCGSKLWRVDLEGLKPVLRTQMEFRKMLLRLFQHQMLQALRAQTDTRGVLDPANGVSSMNHLPGPDSFEWNEFHAFMRIPSETPEIGAKLASYKQWIAELEKAKPSQMVGLLSNIMEESPIGTEMFLTHSALITANTTIRTKTLQTTSSLTALQTWKTNPPVSKTYAQNLATGSGTNMSTALSEDTFTAASVDTSDDEST